jgi:hypothetical protein
MKKACLSKILPLRALLAFFSLFVSPVAQAITDEALQFQADARISRTVAPSATPSVRSGQRALRAVREACWPRAHLPNLRCEFVNLAEQGTVIRDLYHRNRAQRWLSDPASHFSMTVTRSMGDLTRSLSRLSAPAPRCEILSETARICEVPVTNEDEYSLFIEGLRSELQTLRRLAPPAARECFDPCFIKCVVSNLINYTERESEEFGTFLARRYFARPAQLFNDGVGECAEIASLATDIGRRLQIPIANVSSWDHEFNSVRLPRGTFSFDAASASCLFLRDF